MKYLKHLSLGVMLLSVHTYGADASSESTRISTAISACYNDAELNPCLGQISDRKEKNYEAAYSALIKSLGDIGNSNGPLLAREVKHGKAAWEVSAKHNCRAIGLLYDNGSPAYDAAVSDCMAMHYAQQVDFYNSFGISSTKQAMAKILQDYDRTHPKK